MATEVLPVFEPGEARRANMKEMMVRFALGAAVSILAGIVAKAEGARLGGVFLAFPAILPASLTFVEEEEGTRKASRDAIGAVLGGLALVVFAAVAESTLTRINSILALLAALLGWAAASAVLYAGLAAFRPDDCDISKD